MRPFSASRRAILAGGAALAAAASAAAIEDTLPSLRRATKRVTLGDGKYSARAVDLVQRSFVIDMLAAISLERGMRPQGWTLPLTVEQIRDYRHSGLTAIHHSAGLGGPDAHQQALAYLAGWNGFVSRYPDLFVGVASFDDLELAQQSGRTAVIMGLQNSEHFRNLDDVALFHGLGQRVSQLTYNEQNLLGSGSTERVDGGVSDFGAAIVGRMNEVGMLVDVSHCGDRTTLDAIELSAEPIAITHSNCRALNNHPRLKTDEAIRKLAAKGGVIGIAGPRPFVRDREPTTIEHLVDHIDHVVKLVGVEHVGIGSDADLWGYDDLPPPMLERMRAGYKASYGFRDKSDTDGFDHPLKMFELTEVLIRRGYSNDHIEAILGGNFRRLLTAVWSG
jgi:membrane dipeptidase